METSVAIMRRMKRFLPVLIVLPLVLAEDAKPKVSVRDLAMKGVTAWESNQDAATAIECFQKAINTVRAAGGGLVSCLFAPFEGWEADKPKDASYSGGAGQQVMTMLSVHQTHTRKSDKATARLAITNSPQLMTSFQQVVKLYKQPQYQQMMEQQGMSLEERGAWTILITIKGNRTTAMAVHKTVMVQVDLSIDDKALAKKMIDAFPLDKIAKRSAPAPKK